MSDLFDSYASDFAQLRDSIRAKLGDKGALRRAEMEAEEADEVLTQMDIEVQSFPQSVRSRFSLQVRGFKSELEALKKDLRNAGGGAPAYTDDSHLEDQPHSLSQRQRLLQGTATLEDDSRRLEESNRLALETEDIGADILRDLRGQREQIEHSRDTLRQADQSIDRSSKTLTKMIRQAKQQKLLTIGIITILVLLILLILYSKL